MAFRFPEFATVLLVGALLVGASDRARADGEGRLRASAAKVDITPEQPQWFLAYRARRSSGVHDRLYHRILVLHDGTTEFVLVSSDLAVISPSFYHSFCRELERRTGITEDRIWWTVTHNHAAPMVGPRGLLILARPWREQHDPNTEYSRTVLEKLHAGVEEARSNLEPARVGVGVGRSVANVNRRAEDVDGTISLGMNPDRPVDRQIALLRVERHDGTPIALVANYAVHGTALGGGNSKIGGDVPGVVAAYVETKVEAPMLFLNGAAGNVAPIYSTRPDFERAHLDEYERLLGDAILATNRTIGHATSDVELTAEERIVETPRKEGYGWVESLRRYRSEDRGGRDLVRLPIRFLRINREVLIWAAPVELFAQIAIEVRERSPFPHTFFVGYANGWLGYLPIREAFSEGGYEAGSVTPFTPLVEEDVVEAVSSWAQHYHTAE